MTISEGPWTIPSHWRWSTLGEETDVVGGGTPSTKDPSNYDSGDIPWITPADLSGYTEKYITHGRRNITDSGLKGSGARLMPAGTVLFSSRAPIGYVAIARNPVTTNQGFKSFVPNGSLSPDYLYYYLQRAKELAVALSSGTTFPEISGKQARKIPVPVPPLDDQKQIVDEIETQLARLDDAVASLRRARTRLKRYRASVLMAACEGRLVPTEAELTRQEGRTYEPASVLLDRIRAEREANATGKRRKIKPTPPLDASNLSELPEGWAWTSFGQLVTRSEYGTSTKCTYDNKGLPVLRIPNMIGGAIDLTDMKYAPADQALDVGDELHKGDMLICRTNGSVDLVGRSAIIRETLPTRHWFASYLLRFRLADTATLPLWLNYYLWSQPARVWIEQHAASSAGQNNVSLSLLNTMPVPIPPLGEQHRIIGELDRRTSVIENIESTIGRNLKRTEGLRQSILRKAFSGQLVPDRHQQIAQSTRA